MSVFQDIGIRLLAFLYLGNRVLSFQGFKLRLRDVALQGLDFSGSMRIIQ